MDLDGDWLKRPWETLTWISVDSGCKKIDNSRVKCVRDALNKAGLVWSVRGHRALHSRRRTCKCSKESEELLTGAATWHGPIVIRHAPAQLHCQRTKHRGRCPKWGGDTIVILVTYTWVWVLQSHSTEPGSTWKKWRKRQGPIKRGWGWGQDSGRQQMETMKNSPWTFLGIKD